MTLPAEVSTAEFHIEYTVLEGATRRGKDKLVDNQGYSYTVEVGMRRIYRNPSMTDIFKSAALLVEDALLDFDDDLPDASRPVPANLVRSANRLRQGIRPAEPSDLNFEVG